MWGELGLTHRSATMDDIDLVTGLVNEAEIVDLGEASMSRADVEADWSSPHIDITKDVVLVFDGGELVACGEVALERADADVHPTARGRGIGRILVEWTEQRALARAVEGAAVRIGQTVPEGLDGVEQLFIARGYERLWDSWVLRMPPGADLSVPSLPDGITIRPYRPDEEREIHVVIDDAFSEWEERDSQSFEDWRLLVTARPDFDPTLLFVAEAGGAVVGAAAATDYEFEGWLQQMAVRPDFRGRGIAGALLRVAFGELRSRGRERLGLNTDSRTGALGLYTGIGMTVEHTYVRWSRLLRPAPAG